MTDRFLIADIGGTNVRFALADREGGEIRVRDAQSFRAEDFETVRDAAEARVLTGKRPIRG